MPTLEKVTDMRRFEDFCLTDCGPSEGCCPDDYVPVDTKDDKS